MNVIYLNQSEPYITPDIIKYIASKEYIELYIDLSNYYDAHGLYTVNIDGLPNCIRKLTIACNKVNIDNLDNLPCNLEHLTLNNCTNKEALFNNLPPNLKLLHINSNKFDQQLNYLPVTLETLIINSSKFDQSLDNLPPNLKNLYIQCEYFSKDLTNLPISLEMLAIMNCNRYYDKTSLILPEKIKFLSTNCLKDCKNLPVLPDTMEYLDLFVSIGGDKYICEIENELPRNLKQLVVNKKVCLDYAKLPKTLESLVYIENLYEYNVYMNIQECFITNTLPKLYKHCSISLMNYNFIISIYNNCCMKDIEDDS